MNKLLLATTNPGKLEEFRILLAGLPAELLTPKDLGLDLNIDETGASYADNAALKARAYCQESNLITLADDSGLEVFSLGGAPGIFSARYAGQHAATDAARRALLLKNLKGIPRPWRAEFHAVVAIAIPPPTPNFAIKVESIEGVCRGEIIPVERGTNGFGYDAIFLVPEYSRTMAELRMEEKNLVSHRARAINAAMPVLHSLL